MNLSPLRRRRERPGPEDPTVAALVEASQRAQLSRRRLLQAGVGLPLVGAGLSACAPPLPPAGGGLTSRELPEDLSDTEKTVKWANWTAYLDYDEETKTNPTLEAFIEDSGIQASYFEDIDDNDSYYSKIAPQLRNGQSIDRDLFTLTDWMAGRVIRDELCQPLELIRMPNVVANLLEPLKEVTFDPGRYFSVTWQSGYGGIGYNKEKVGRELRTLDDLWTDDLKGKVTVLSEFRDTLGVVMLAQGVNIDEGWGKTEFENAVAYIEEKIDQGYIRKVKGNSYLEDMTSGNAWAGIVWSGDIFILAADTGDDNWTFTIPESGGTLWSDNLMVPITSQHRRNAQELINYYYDPAVAAEVAAWVNYVSPVVGAKEEMDKVDPELAASPLIFPTADWITEHNVRGFRVLTADEDVELSDIWSQRVMGN